MDSEKIELIEFNLGLLQKIELELRRARRRFPANMHSFHEGYAIILEEVEELWAEIKADEEHRDKSKIMKEGIHSIAMIVRMLQDLIIKKN